MFDHAASKQESDSRISWRQADALDLPFDDASFEVVVCQFGVMFFPDRSAGYSEAYRVLKPGGKLIFNVWDRIETNEFADVVTGAAATVFPDDPPQFLPRTPHGYHDENLIREELHGGGFTEVSYESLETTSSAPSPHHPASVNRVLMGGGITPGILPSAPSGPSSLCCDVQICSRQICRTHGRCATVVLIPASLAN